MWAPPRTTKFAPNLIVSGDLTDSYFAFEGAGDVPFSSDVSGELVPADPLDACERLSNSIGGELAPGLYGIFVHGFETDGPDANYTLFHWASGAAAGNMAVSGPSSAILGATETITVDWSGLAAGEKYLGAVVHGDGSSTLGRTVISVSTE